MFGLPTRLSALLLLAGAAYNDTMELIKRINDPTFGECSNTIKRINNWDDCDRYVKLNVYSPSCYMTQLINIHSWQNYMQDSWIGLFIKYEKHFPIDPGNMYVELVKGVIEVNVYTEEATDCYPADQGTIYQLPIDENDPWRYHPDPHLFQLEQCGGIDSDPSLPHCTPIIEDTSRGVRKYVHIDRDYLKSRPPSRMPAHIALRLICMDPEAIYGSRKASFQFRLWKRVHVTTCYSGSKYNNPEQPDLCDRSSVDMRPPLLGNARTLLDTEVPPLVEALSPPGAIIARKYSEEDFERFARHTEDDPRVRSVLEARQQNGAQAAMAQPTEFSTDAPALPPRVTEVETAE